MSLNFFHFTLSLGEWRQIANSNIVTTLTQKIDLPNGDYAARGAMSMEISFSLQLYRFISTLHFFQWNSCGILSLKAFVKIPLCVANCLEKWTFRCFLKLANGSKMWRGNFYAKCFTWRVCDKKQKEISTKWYKKIKMSVEIEENYS